MVDRCFAMWQVLNPSSYVVPWKATYNTFTTYANQIQDSNSALTPFYRDTAGSFWTAAEVVDTTTFGYAYTETVENAPTQVIAAINTLYGPSSTGTVPGLARTLSRASVSNVVRTLSERDSNNYTEWIANIQVKKYALNTPFFVLLFLGTISPDPESWLSDPNLVGSHFISVKGAEAIATSALRL